MTQGENARLTCQVPRTNDFFIAPSEWLVVPAKAGITASGTWISACARWRAESILLLRVAIAHCAPESFRGCRHLDVPHAEGGERVDQRIGDRGHGADAARFARAFDPERIGAGGHRIALHLDCADVARARHGVVHEGTSQVLAVAVEFDVLHQDLADALRDAARDLSLQQQRIDDGADVVHDAVAHDLYFAGLLIDLELADVAAVGEILHRRKIGRGRDQPDIHVFRQLRRLHRLLRYILDGERPVGLGTGEHAVGKVDITRIDVEEMRRDRLALGCDPLDRRGDRRSADGGRARSAGAFAHEDLISVALNVVHLLRIDAKAVAHDLLEDRLVALTLGNAAGQQGRRARLVKPDLGAFKALRCCALDRVGEPDAAQLAALARFAAPALEP